MYQPTRPCNHSLIQIFSSDMYLMRASFDKQYYIVWFIASCLMKMFDRLARVKNSSELHPEEAIASHRKKGIGASKGGGEGAFSKSKMASTSCSPMHPLRPLRYSLFVGYLINQCVEEINRFLQIFLFLFSCCCCCCCCGFFFSLSQTTA